MSEGSEKPKITVRTLKVSDAILFLLVNSDVAGQAISDARFLAAVQDLYHRSDGLLRYRMRGYQSGGVSTCVRRVTALWSMGGLMPMLITDNEAGLVVSGRAVTEYKGRFCEHVKALLGRYLDDFRSRIHDQALPESNPAGCEIVQQVAAG